MARGSQQAQTAGTSAQDLSNSLAGNASGLESTLAPELESEVTNPQGYTPTQKANMTTAAEQSVGGGQASAIGAGALAAARTRNAGTADAAIQGSTRATGENLSNLSTGIEKADANVQQENRQAGLQGLGSLTGLETGSSISALGIVPQAVNANTQAAEQSWDWAKYILDPTIAASGQAGAAALAG